MRPTVAQIGECVLAILGDEPDHAWATPTIQVAFAWREGARVLSELRRLEYPCRLVCSTGTFGQSGRGRATWWWLAEGWQERGCCMCRRLAAEWSGGVVMPSWKDPDRPYVPDTGGWCCGAAHCRAAILTRQWEILRGHPEFA